MNTTTERKALRTAALAALSAIALGAILAPAADASFPGRNGRLAIATMQTDLAGTLQTVNPDGTGVETLIRPQPDLGAALRPEWSGDGQRLILNLQERTEGPAPGFAGLATFDVATKMLAKLPHQTVYDTAASWSPDGTRVAFTRAGRPDRYGGRTVIYTAKADGSDVRRIADGTDPQFSPDGRTLAYAARSTPKGGGGIVLRDARTGKKIRRVTTTGMKPDWAPDGKRLLYIETGARHGRVMVVARDGRNRRLLMKKNVGGGAAEWSPDGKSIAYTRRVYRAGSDEQYGYVVRTRRLKTGAERSVFTTPILDAEDGAQYAFIAWQPLQD